MGRLGGVGGHSLRLDGPVIAHQFVGPKGLTNGLTRKKLSHDWLQVKDGRAVDGIEFDDIKALLLHADDRADGAAQAVRAVLAALCKDADSGPRGIVARVAGTGDDFGGVDLMEEKRDLDMRKVGEALEGLGRELFDEGDAGLLVAPEVIFGVEASGLDEANGFDALGHTLIVDRFPWLPGLAMRWGLQWAGAQDDKQELVDDSRAVDFAGGGGRTLSGFGELLRWATLA